MSSTSSIVLVRQVIIRTIQLAPFVLGFLYIPVPFNVMVPCLLALKIKLPSETDLYELQVLGKHIALIATKCGNEADRENMNLMKQTFGFSDELLHQADIDGSGAKFAVDLVFGLIEAIGLLVMILSFLVQIS